MPMRATTVRFSEDLWDLLEQEARGQSISAAQFVRDATILRLAFLMGQRGDPQATATVAQVAAGTLGRAPAGPPASPPSVADPDRLEAVRATGLLDSPADPAYDRLAALAARVVDAPVALVSLVDADRQFFKSCVGLAEPWAQARETPLSHSFCQFAVDLRRPLVIEDAREDAAFRDSLAIAELDVVAYLGIPLILAGGAAVGSLCVIDDRPRRWTAEQVELVADIAGAVVHEMERREPA